MRLKLPRIAGYAIACFALLAGTVAAFAHASERGHVLLLPTSYYLMGGAMAVVFSFVVLAFMPPGALLQAGAWRLRLCRYRPFGKFAASTFSFAAFAFLLHVGWAGSRDPLANLLPLTVWTVLWLCLTLAQGIFGFWWPWLNPWYGPWRIWTAVTGQTAREDNPFLILPNRVGRWPAFAILFAFAWFELVSLAPDDPGNLAGVVVAYWLFTFACIVLFGYGTWMARGEFFSVFFRLVSHLAVFAVRAGYLWLVLPGAKLRHAPVLPASGVAFVLLALAYISFDGLMRTFAWLQIIGVNPLEFPGRSAVILQNTLGLAGMVTLFAVLFLAAILAGEKLAGGKGTARAAGALVWSFVPIALAYHFSHYLVVMLVNGQYALAAASDPLARGWNLFGTADMPIRAGLTLGADAAWAIWNAQAAAIVGGHVLAIILAHATAYGLYGSARRAALSQIPMAVLMIFYTVFGLWLLSTPTAG
ncbi:hypothetical protein [Nitratireductor luteus]|uniref:hypothetical protein n=1 Tax=Nitratireductor luteus TaxID=2976980 RepID=UPI0022407475|nr:hypothetical protein [Nitratireductor luteus]